MVLVAWATLIGPDQVFTGRGRRAGPPSPVRCVPLADATTADGTTDRDAGQRRATCRCCEEPTRRRDGDRDLVEQTAPPLLAQGADRGSSLLAVLAAVLALVGSRACC